jgi:hypothetical protein
VAIVSLLRGGGGGQVLHELSSFEVENKLAGEPAKKDWPANRQPMKAHHARERRSVPRW